MHSIESLLLRIQATQTEETDETDEDKENEREEKHNGFFRNLATKPPFSTKRRRHNQKRPLRTAKIKKRRGSQEAECIPTNSCSDAAVLSEATKKGERAIVGGESDKRRVHLEAITRKNNSRR
jgi:hypothetical protein